MNQGRCTVYGQTMQYVLRKIGFKSNGSCIFHCDISPVLGERVKFFGTKVDVR